MEEFSSVWKAIFEGDVPWDDLTDLTPARSATKYIPADPESEIMSASLPGEPEPMSTRKAKAMRKRAEAEKAALAKMEREIKRKFEEDLENVGVGVGLKSLGGGSWRINRSSRMILGRWRYPCLEKRRSKSGALLYLIHYIFCKCPPNQRRAMLPFSGPDNSLLR